MTYAIGDRVGDLTFQLPDGSSARLSHFTARNLVLIFLRHLG
jgi:peroxiredoxin